MYQHTNTPRLSEPVVMSSHSHECVTHSHECVTHSHESVTQSHHPLTPNHSLGLGGDENTETQRLSLASP